MSRSTAPIKATVMQIVKDPSKNMPIPSEGIMFTKTEIGVFKIILLTENWRDKYAQMVKAEKEVTNTIVTISYYANSFLKVPLRSLWDKLQKKFFNPYCDLQAKKDNYQTLFFSTLQVKFLIDTVDELKKAEQKKTLASSTLKSKTVDLQESKSLSLKKLPDLYKALDSVVAELLAPLTAAIPVDYRVESKKSRDNNPRSEKDKSFTDWKLWGTSHTEKLAAILPVKLRGVADAIKEELGRQGFSAQVKADEKDLTPCVMLMVTPQQLTNEQKKKFTKKIAKCVKSLTISTDLFTKKIESISIFSTDLVDFNQRFQIAKHLYQVDLESCKTMTHRLVEMIFNYISQHKLTNEQLETLNAKAATAFVLLGSACYSRKELLDAKSNFTKALEIRLNLFGENNDKTQDVKKRLEQTSNQLTLEKS